ncbi:hypothetical protein CAOG_05682 [Capsaspora owczarzaki ATCC 30864]|uniref:Uncharacterized protein n=1 Tax=Capsaspora owczarzaki (strain ATCC 30864) TaxID=595528 RepID=A0A0D2WSL7_CAPO3|nr:hypothetical protein CAOG_05682 [Capsaspora owczarzaki ATCC 30864]KJE95204.1 hypothetical protein CAOG_005682 [Capsaspora owczarzaki ATCC 30864]KJE95205.1 hypothetical protein, variant [Capsaspora owczarzaki ATCC 30864]|eukprot:XP_004346355.1 hypothetical protein CAOG_05682 [Capsaspora owczarzaki ATCC 30864]
MFKQSALLLMVAAVACTHALPIRQQEAPVTPSGAQIGEYDPCVHPIVMIPGLGASVLDYYLTSEYKFIHPECELLYPRNKWSSGINRLWPSIESSDIIPPHHIRECWEDMIQVFFNSTTLESTNQVGVLVRPRDYGGIEGIANLFAVESDYGFGFSAVYERWANTLIHKTPGYVDHMNVRGAPYDFRMVACDSALQSMYSDLKTLIEDTYELTRSCATGPRKVFVSTHSLGGPYYLHFLNTFVNQTWKDLYLESFLSVSSPFLGASMAYSTAISGNSEGLPGSSYAFLPVERLMGGVLWMIPNGDYFGTQPLVQVGNRNYTAQLTDVENSLPSLLRQLPLDRSGAIDILQKVIQPRGNPLPPNTTMHCMYGTTLPTEGFDYYADINATTVNPNKYREPVIRNGKVLLSGADPLLLLPMNSTNPYYDDAIQGDKVVQLPSLTLCQNWVGNNAGHGVEIVPFAGQEHVGLLKSDPFMAYIMGVMDAANKASALAAAALLQQ